MYHQLKQVQEFLKPLTEKVVDTIRAVGSEAFSAARTFYKAVQDASITLKSAFRLKGRRTGDGDGSAGN